MNKSNMLHERSLRRGAALAACLLGAGFASLEIGRASATQMIVGYNEHAAGGGTLRTGSHNVVTGFDNSFESFGGIVGGSNNSITNAFAAVSGGRENTASGAHSSVSGGRSASSRTRHGPSRSGSATAARDRRRTSPTG